MKGLKTRARKYLVENGAVEANDFDIFPVTNFNYRLYHNLFVVAINRLRAKLCFGVSVTRIALHGSYYI